MNGISVVIPTLNRTSFLKQTLECLAVQKFVFPFEIIIVDQSNQEDEEVKNYSRSHELIKYYYITQFRGLPEARNFGWQHSKYDYILYLDDDITCTDNLLEEHYKYISKKEIGVVAGGITEVYKNNNDSKIGDFNYWTANPKRGFHLADKKEVIHAGGGNFCIKKEAIEKSGGIDEKLTKGAALYEELDVCLRVRKTGYKIFFNYYAHVNHLAADSGGCRVHNINKYFFSLVRNRSIIIKRHLKWYHKITAQIYLLKLLLAFSLSYKKLDLFKEYIRAIKEAKDICKLPVKVSKYKNTISS